MQQQNQLQHIFTYSKSGPNLLNISIVQQITGDQPYQKKVFCFLTAIPGAIKETGTRTFNHDSKITMKVEYDKILSLGKVIRSYIYGQENLIGPFTIFVDSSKSQYGSSGSTKYMTIQKRLDQKTNTPIIILLFKSQKLDSPIAIPLSFPDALAIAEICEWIAKKCLELDFELESSASFTAKSLPNPKLISMNDKPPIPINENQKTLNNITTGFSQGIMNIFNPDSENGLPF